MVEGTVVAGAQEMPAGARGAPLAKQPRGLQEEQRGGRRLCAGCSSCVLKSWQAGIPSDRGFGACAGGTEHLSRLGDSFCRDLLDTQHFLGTRGRISIISLSSLSFVVDPIKQNMALLSLSFAPCYIGMQLLCAGHPLSE